MIKGCEGKTVPFLDKPGMSVNTESKHDDRELPGINWILFSRAQKAGSGGLSPVRMHDAIQGCFAAAGKELQGRTPAGCREKGPWDADVSGALAERS